MTEHSARRELATLLGLAFLVLMLASLGLRFWATQAMLDNVGPTHIAATEQRVLVHVNDILYDMAADGNVAAVYPPDRTGLAGDLIDLRILQSGQVLLAQQKPLRVRACDSTTWVCSQVDMGSGDSVDRQFKIVPDTSTTPGGYLLTDARGDALWRSAGDGSGLVALLQSGELAGPNDLAFGHAGNLWIADTDHRRLVEWREIDSAAPQPGRAHSAVNSLTRDERHYPMMLAPDHRQRWWVIQASEYSEGVADVVIYHPDQGAVARVELPGSVYPTDLARSGGRMLITDLESFMVFSVDVNTLATTRFGDARFLHAMAGIEVRRHRLDRTSAISLAGVIAFAALMIGAGIYATPRGKRLTPVPGAVNFEAAADSTPATAGIHWLEKNPALERAAQMLGIASFALPVVIIAGGLLLYALNRDPLGQAASPQAALLVLALALPLVSVFLVLRRLAQQLGNHLGSDGKRIWMRLHDGRTLNVQPSEVAHNGRAVFHQQHMLLLAGGKGQAMYADGEVDTWLAPLLKTSTTYTAAQSLKHRWRHREAQLMTLLALALVMVLVFVFALGLLLVLQPLSA